MLSIPEEIKELLHRDSCQKNIRIHFPNGERSDICNDMIIKDSVKLTESLCSQETLKFGLCESPVFECSVVGMENMKGATIEVFNEVYCEPYVEGAVFRPDLQAYVYPIPYGTFVISECKRDADMQYRKMQAYGQLISEDTAVHSEIFSWATKNPYGTNVAYQPYLLYVLLAGFGMNKEVISDEYFVESQDIDSAYFVSVGARNYVRYGFLCKAISKTYDTWPNVLHYRKYGTNSFSKTISEAIDDCVSQGAPRIVTAEELENTDIFKELISHNDRFYYNYQGDNPRNVFEPLEILIPYAVAIQHPGITPAIYYSSSFRGNSEDMIYEISDTQYPSIKLSYSREINPIDQRYYLNKNAVDWSPLLQSYIELIGMFAKFNHDKIVEFINIKKCFAQTPSSELYPGASTFPQGATGGKLLPNDYQSVWYDDEYTKPFGKIYVPYKNTSNVDVIFEYYLTGYDETSDINSYQTYDLSSNEIIKARTWTQSEIESICQTIASNIEGVTYMPVEFTGRGLPYVEPGDTFEILTKSNDSITTIVLNRTLSGEQVLTDTYKSN